MSEQGNPKLRTSLLWIVAFLLTTYAIAYVALLERRVYRLVGWDAAAGVRQFKTEPQYSFPSLAIMLEPVHRIDRVVRHRFWANPERPATPVGSP